MSITKNPPNPSQLDHGGTRASPAQRIRGADIEQNCAGAIGETIDFKAMTGNGQVTGGEHLRCVP